MRLLLCVSGLMALLWGCGPGTSQSENPMVFLPAGAQAWLQINDTEAFRLSLRENEVLQTYRKAHPESWLTTIDSILSLNLGNSALLAWSNSASNSRDWVVIFKEPQFEVSDSIDRTTTAWTLPENYLWKTRSEKNWRLIASSESLLQESISAAYVPEKSLETALKTANPMQEANLFIRSSHADPVAVLCGDFQNYTASGEPPTWSAFDLKLGSESLLVSGMQQHYDSIVQQVSLFQDIPLLPLNEAAQWAPEESDAVFSFSLQDPSQFLTNQDRLLGKPNPWVSLVESVEQLSLIEHQGAVALVLTALNQEAIASQLEPYRSGLPEFQEVTLYSLQQNRMLNAAFEPLLNQIPEPGYYAQLNELFVFTSTLESLQNWISAYKRESTFATQEWYTQLKANLISEESAFGLVKNIENSTLIQDSTFVLGRPRSQIKSLPKGYLMASQINATTPVTYNTVQWQRKSNLSSSGRGVSLHFSKKLEGSVTAGPFFLKNHNTGTMDIAVQDDQNQLYLFSDKGTLFWKKTLRAAIQGSIQQVDLYKNGRLQMAFTTTDELVVLDRNGETVKPFPLKFPGGNLNPLALFDYEQNRNYRFVVTQGRKVFMYDTNGKPVNGFKFKDAGADISRPPQHMRIGNRDYLVFRLENGQIRILNRVGDVRVKVNETFDFSDNDIFLFEGTFTFSERNGNLISISPSGKLSKRNLNLNADHGMYATSKTLALMNDNVLRIKENQVALELGVYLGPRLFYLNDIIYVAATDVQSQKLYLFRSTGAALSGFPIEAQGLPEMADLDGDRQPELGVRYRDSTIAIYGLRR